MSKTTKIVIFINVVVSIFLLVILSTRLYAWYVRTSHTEALDVSTNGIVLSYTIDDSDEVNVNEYSISNLVFFDTTSEDEGKYLTSMCHIIQIDVTNQSKKNVDVTLSYVEPDSTSSPYVYCIISKINTLNSENEDGSVEDYISDNNLETTQTSTNIQRSYSTTFYVYIFGIQPDSEATNDFLYENQASNTGEEYLFKLKIKATVSEGQEAEITQETESNSSTI